MERIKTGFLLMVRVYGYRIHDNWKWDFLTLFNRQVVDFAWLYARHSMCMCMCMRMCMCDYMICERISMIIFFSYKLFMCMLTFCSFVSWKVTAFGVLFVVRQDEMVGHTLIFCFIFVCKWLFLLCFLLYRKRKKCWQTKSE